MKFQDAPKFADSDEPTLADFKHGTLAWVIQQMIEDIAAQPETMKPLGSTHLYGLRAAQRTEFCGKRAASLTRHDFIAFMKWRRKKVGPSTAGQTLSQIRGALKYAVATWDDCADLADTLVALSAAQLYLEKHGLISKSQPRDRRPTGEELTALQQLGAQRNKHRQTKINMERLIRWQPASGRRISETCRIEWRTWDPDKQTILVTKMKDPKRRNKNKIVALTDEAQEILFEMALEMNADPKTWNDQQPRIFPYVARSCTAAFIEMKKKLGIHVPRAAGGNGLRLHDNRRECGSRIIDAGGTSDDAILVTGHDDTKVFDAVYKAPKPELFKERMAKRALLNQSEMGQH